MLSRIETKSKKIEFFPPTSFENKQIKNTLLAIIELMLLHYDNARRVPSHPLLLNWISSWIMRAAKRPSFRLPPQTPFHRKDKIRARNTKREEFVCNIHSCVLLSIKKRSFWMGLLLVMAKLGYFFSIGLHEACTTWGPPMLRQNCEKNVILQCDICVILTVLLERGYQL